MDESLAAFDEMGLEEFGGESEAPRPVAEREPSWPLPRVAELAGKLPPSLAPLLEDLFRARPTQVKRIRPEDLR